MSQFAEIEITSGSSQPIHFVPQDYTIDFDSLADRNSGRTADGTMVISWILTKVNKLTVKLPPHHYMDKTYSVILSYIQGQVVTVKYWDYLEHTLKTEQMYCSQTSAGYSYQGLVHDVSFELIAMTGTDTAPTHIVLTPKTATWKNWNGTTLTTTQVEPGETPSYPGSTPTRPADVQYTYTFSGWSPAPAPINANTTYTAQYSTTTNQYTLTVLAGENGSVSGGGTYNYGTSVTLTATPDTGYVFDSWSDGNTSSTRSVTVTGNATYTATFAPEPLYWTVEWNNSLTFSDEDWEVEGTLPFDFTCNNTNCTAIYISPEGETDFTGIGLVYDAYQGDGWVSDDYKVIRMDDNPNDIFLDEWSNFLDTNGTVVPHYS